MPFIEHYASNLVYLLTVRCLDCNNIRPGDINTTIISDWRTDQITYTVFQSGDPSSRVIQPIESYKYFEVIATTFIRSTYVSTLGCVIEDFFVGGGLHLQTLIHHSDLARLSPY